MKIREFSKEQISLVKSKIEQVLWEIGMRVEMAEVRDMCLLPVRKSVVTVSTSALKC